MSDPGSQPKTAPRPKSPPGVSPAARAAHWTSRITAISLEMVLPGLAGYWLDQKLGTKALFMLIGFVLGGVAAFGHLMHLARKSSLSSVNKGKTYIRFREHEGDDKL